MNTAKRLIFFIVCMQSLLLSAEADAFYRVDDKEVIIDKERNLMWQDDSAASSTDKNYADAVAHCESLDLAGYTDWYLPSVDELKSIIKAENYPRSIAKAFQNVYPDYYWSSTEYSSELAWIVLFIYEDVTYYHKSDPSYVRCVRKVE
jgi:hypothetical protein